jgi:hypothetical protein
MTDARPLVTSQLREQAQACEAMGSPLYARLLLSAARDAEDGGPTWSVLRDHVRPGRGDALALRLMAALHRLALTGRAPALARHYPSAGGDASLDGAWDAFRDVLASQAEEVGALVARRCQTNEVGRAAALVFGFLEVAASASLPMRVLEVGASAGLNLRWDRFRYGGGGASWGDALSPVDLTGLWAEPPEHVEVSVEVVERRGCDLRPVDPTSEEGGLALRASIWADQLPRFARLRGALDLAGRVSAAVDQASVEEWLPAQLACRRSGIATVVYHSVVDEYLPDETRRAFHACLQDAGARAAADAPLAWLQLEPLTELRHHGVRLVTWPGRRERLIATCGAHGQEARCARGGASS